jgi:hypothetical protein
MRSISVPADVRQLGWVASGLVELDSSGIGRFGLERADEALESDLDPTVPNPSSTRMNTKKATTEQSSFVAIPGCLSDRCANVDADLRTRLNHSLRIWRAGWVHALTSSNLASSARLARDQRFRVCCSFGRGALPHHRGGAPPVLRREAAHLVEMSAPALVDAIGDVCSRFFNRAGQPVTFPCSERPLGLNLQPLMQIPV